MNLDLDVVSYLLEKMSPELLVKRGLLVGG
jgi:hypothetical protein